MAETTEKRNVDIHDAEDQELQRKKTVTQRLLLGKIRAGVLPTPTMITDTGCGYGLYYVLSNTIANTKAAEKIKGYYTAVYNALIKRFQQELPGLVDPSVKDAARICRLPGTTNPVSGTVCRLVYCDLERKWNLKDLSGYVNLEEYKRKKSLLSVKDVSRLPKRGESAFACSGSNLSESSRASGEKVVLACVNICSFSLSVFSCR